MAKRDYDGVYWGFRRNQFDNYDEGGDDLPEEEIAPSPGRFGPGNWNFDLQKWFGRAIEQEEPTPVQQPDPPKSSDLLSQALRRTPKIGAWVAKQGWNTVGPTLKRTVEGVPGWGIQPETLPDEELAKMVTGLEVQQERLARRLETNRKKLEKLRIEYARRHHEPIRDSDKGTNSSNTPGTML